MADPNRNGRSLETCVQLSYRASASTQRTRKSLASGQHNCNSTGILLREIYLRLKSLPCMHHINRSPMAKTKVHHGSTMTIVSISPHINLRCPHHHRHSSRQGLLSYPIQNRASWGPHRSRDYQHTPLEDFADRKISKDPWINGHGSLCNDAVQFYSSFRERTTEEKMALVRTHQQPGQTKAARRVH